MANSYANMNQELDEIGELAVAFMRAAMQSGLSDGQAVFALGMAAKALVMDALPGQLQKDQSTSEAELLAEAQALLIKGFVQTIEVTE